MKAVLKPQPFPEIIEGDRIVLKKNSILMASEIFRLVNSERGRLREFLPWVDRTQSLQDEVNYIEMTHRWWQELSAFDYSFFRKSDGVYMGNGGVHTVTWAHEHLEIGYFIGQEFEGQGYVSELVKLMEKTAFEVGFYRIEIRCDPRNVRSSALALRNGHVQEGHLKKNSLIGSQRRDTLVFAKLRES